MKAGHPQTVYVTGMRGSGKSTLVAALQSQWVGSGIDVWVVDPMWEHPIPPGGRRFRPSMEALDSDGMEADGPLHDAANEVAKKAWLRRPRERRCIVVFDDVNLCVRHGQQGPPFVNTLVHQGRHRNVGFCFVVRRPAETPRDWSSQADHRCVFRVRELIDQRSVLAQGVPTTHEALGELPDGHFWHLGRKGAWHLHQSFMEVKDGVPVLSACLTD